MLRTLLLSLLCLLLLGPQAAFPVASGQAPPVTEKNLPLNRTTFHFFSPEDIAANYRSPKIVRVGYFDQHGVLQGKGTKVVATISTDPFFFVTRRNNSAIMDPLNEAMRQILLNHPSYLARLYDSYLNIASDVPVVFTRSECRWLATSPAIRVAYSRRQDMMDPEHGATSFLRS